MNHTLSLIHSYCTKLITEWETQCSTTQIMNELKFESRWTEFTSRSVNAREHTCRDSLVPVSRVMGLMLLTFGMNRIRDVTVVFGNFKAWDGDSALHWPLDRWTLQTNNQIFLLYIPYCTPHTDKHLLKKQKLLNSFQYITINIKQIFFITEKQSGAESFLS